MGLLDRLFGAWQGRDRLAKAPSGHTGGKLAPASVQRAHLGLRDVDLPTGVVRLRTGEVRAVLAVSGVPVHHRDPEDALDFLRAWAAALNAMPADVVLLSRARHGGWAFEDYAQGKAAASTALAKTAPGTGLARLARDQLANALRLAGSGQARDVVHWLAVRDGGGDVPRLLERAGQAAARLRAVGLRVEPLKDRALAAAISESWRPGTTEAAGADYYLRRGDPDPAWVLSTESDGRRIRAKVTRPRFVDAPPDPPPILTTQKGRPLGSGAARKALPR